MSDRSKYFLKKSEEVFHFLVDEYGCRVIKTEENVYATEITYTNSTTGVIVSFEPRENAIFVYLVRLVDGQLGTYIDIPRHWWYLHEFILLRCPSFKILHGPRVNRLTNHDIETILVQYATALRKFADDILRGDFSESEDQAGRSSEKP